MEMWIVGEELCFGVEMDCYLRGGRGRVASVGLQSRSRNVDSSSSSQDHVDHQIHNVKSACSRCPHFKNAPSDNIRLALISASSSWSPQIPESSMAPASLRVYSSINHLAPKQSNSNSNSLLEAALSPPHQNLRHYTQCNVTRSRVSSHRLPDYQIEL